MEVHNKTCPTHFSCDLRQRLVLGGHHESPCNGEDWKFGVFLSSQPRHLQVTSSLERAGFPRALGGLQSFPHIPGSSGDAESLCSKGSSPATAAGTEPAKLSPFLDPARKAL